MTHDKLRQAINAATRELFFGIESDLTAREEVILRHVAPVVEELTTNRWPCDLTAERAANVAHRMSCIVHDLEGCRIPHDIGLKLMNVVLEGMRQNPGKD